MQTLTGFTMALCVLTYATVFGYIGYNMYTIIRSIVRQLIKNRARQLRILRDVERDKFNWDEIEFDNRDVKCYNKH